MSKEIKKKNPLLMRLSSLKITVACLLLFMVITVLGTLYQVNHGISEARDIYFNSWGILVGGMIPFPGGQLILWIFAVNLVASCIVRFSFKLKNIGLWLTHLGLLVLCFSSFYTYQFSIEANLHIAEGDTSEFAMVDDKWELAVWFEENGDRVVTSYPMDLSKLNSTNMHVATNLNITVTKYIEDSEPVQDFNAKREFHNVSGLSDIKEKSAGGKPTRSIPGLTIEVKHEADIVNILLYGAEMYSTQIQTDKHMVHFQLRPQRLKLPVKVKLVDVKQDLYEGTQMAKNYESKVKLIDGETEREVRIFMNHPLSVESFTFYQSSYGRAMDGRETSTLSVVKNTGKYYPYIACILTSLGMLIHFILIPFVNAIVNPSKNEE